MGDPNNPGLNDRANRFRHLNTIQEVDDALHQLALVNNANALDQIDARERRREINSAEGEYIKIVCLDSGY